MGLWIGTSPERPDLLVDAAGKTVAVRGLDGRLALMGDRPTAVLAGRFASEQWLAAEGSRSAHRASRTGWPPPLCDRLGCTLPMIDRAERRPVVSSAIWLVDDCRLAAVLVTPFEPPEDCAAYVVRIAPDGSSGAQAAPSQRPDGPQRSFAVVRKASNDPWLLISREKTASAAVEPPRPITPIDPAGTADTQALPPEQAVPAPDQ